MKWSLLLIIPVMLLLVSLIVNSISQEDIDQIQENIILAFYQDIDCRFDNSSRELIGTLTATVTNQASPSVVSNSCNYNAAGKVVFPLEHFAGVINSTIIVWSNKQKGGDSFDVVIGADDNADAGDWRGIEFDERGGNEGVKVHYIGTGGGVEAKLSGMADVIFGGTHFNMYTSRRNVSGNDVEISIMINVSATNFARGTATGFVPQNTDLTIGVLERTGGQDFAGDMDELIMLNFTASDEQVQWIYDENLAGRHILFAVPITDTCTAPGSGDWDIDCSDNCVLDSAQDVVADMHLNGIGTIVLSAPLTFTGSNQILSVASGCTLDIRSGGEIGGT